MTPGASKNKKKGSERHNWLANYTILITQAFFERQPFGWNRNNKYFNKKKERKLIAFFFLVEITRFELVTYALRTHRSTN